MISQMLIPIIAFIIGFTIGYIHGMTKYFHFEGQRVDE
jgi:hypothetical protein